MRRGIAIAAGALVLALLAGTWAFTLLAPGDRFAECREGAVAGGEIGGPFELVSETGETVTEAEAIDAPTLLYFGYTFCPDVCPLDAARNAAAVEILEEEDGIAANPVFVSFDPARDTPEVLDLFTDNFHPRMLGLTGSEAQVAEAARAYRVFYEKGSDDPDYYTMNHSTFSYIVLPEAGVVDVVRRDEPPEAVAERMACFVAAAEN